MLQNRKKLYHLIQKNDGFTIVELLVVSLLVVIVFFFAMNFIVTSGNFFNLNTDKADAQSQARLIFQGLTKELSTATSVQIVDTGPTNGLEVKKGEIGFKVEHNMLYMIEVTDDKTIKEPAYNNAELDSLVIDFISVPGNPKLLKIAMTANTDEVFETQVYIPNISEIKMSTVPAITQGRGLLIQP